MTRGTEERQQQGLLVKYSAEVGMLWFQDEHIVMSEQEEEKAKDKETNIVTLCFFLF